MNTWKVVNQVLLSVAAVAVIVLCVVVVCKKEKAAEQVNVFDVITKWEEAKEKAAQKTEQPKLETAAATYVEQWDTSIDPDSIN